MQDTKNEKNHNEETLEKESLQPEIVEIFSTEQTPAFEKREKPSIGRIIAIAAILLSLCAALVVGCMLLLKHNQEPVAPSLEKKPNSVEKQPQLKPESVVSDDEIRGVYIASVSNINFPSRSGLSVEQLRKELDEIVETSRQIGFDTIYFQVRPSGDALYNSDLFPVSRYLTGEEGKAIDFDPLAYIVERAAEFDMEVVAWVNPYRVTAAKAKNKNAALATLSDDNFAKKNPELTVFYGGKLYYNPASKEVRELIANGVQEICDRYDVAGILFDDYFYPYPVDKETFDDAASYKAANTSLSLGDWRRDNVNQMVKLTYDTVKSISPELTFGISPFGIWKNASSDPRGSDTRGLEAYSSLYCDALAWIEGGYIDYISPQIYWERGYSVADFATLTRWWSAQVDGTDVKLVISHAAYRASEFKAGGVELSEQIQYARSYMGSCGNIQYGYEDISKNTAGVRDALTELYSTPFEEEEVSSATGISFLYPGKGVKTTDSARFVTARTNPKYPVYSQAVKVGRTKNGFLTILMPLSVGSNTLTLTQNGVDYSLSVTRLASSSPSTLSKFQIQSVTPSKDDGVLASSGMEIPVSVTAPRGCRVVVSLGETSITLTPTLNQKGEGRYVKEVYKGNISVPLIAEGDEPISVGNLTYTVSGEKDLSYEGADVRVIPASLSMTATVMQDYTYLKIAPDSSFYDDYTPASVGMRDYVVAAYDSHYKFAFGGFVAKSAAELNEETELPPAVLKDFKNTVGNTCDFQLFVNAAPPLDVKVSEKTVKITLFSTETTLDKNLELDSKNTLFQSGTVYYDEASGNTVLTLKLISDENFYGFDHSYSDGSIFFSFRKPSALAKGDQPLAGKKIVIDAGHGGTDAGALGFLADYNENDLNLAISLALREKLEALGADVLMTRSDDSTVSLTERMAFLQRESPDLSISVHHNSVNEATDANTARGTLGLYWSAAGKSLAEFVQKGVPRALFVRDIGVRAQKLALCRNHRFPQTLVETQFICSPAEYEAATRGDYANTCANAMAEGVLNWYRMQEGYLKGETS